MNPRPVIFTGILAMIALAAGPSAAQEPKTRSSIAAWETAAPSPQPIAPDILQAKKGWQPIAANETPSAAKGDLAISNGKILAVARRQGQGLELYSLSLGQPIFRARLLSPNSGAIENIALTELGKSALTLEISTKSATTRYRLKKGDLFIEAQSISGTSPLRVECPSRFAVLPDFFADDILFDARKVAHDRVELPSENFLLHLTGKQDAIVMSVFENRAQDVRVTLTGKGDDRIISGSEIDFGKKGSKIWVAVIEGEGIWHSVEVKPNDINKVIKLDWKMPFTAQWRVDFTRQDDLTDSWDMLLPEKVGDGYIKPSWLAQDGKVSPASKTSTGEIDVGAYRPGGPASDRLTSDRLRWTTVLGQVKYPCWSDRNRNGYLQPIKHRRFVFAGPVVIYPITRLVETPVAQYTPVDIVRGTLGVGPCQYLLDVEGQKQEHVGRATCHVRAALIDVYAGGQQKAKRKEIEQYLNDALEFVTHIRKRVLAYVAFGKDMRKYLAEQRGAHPELKEQLDALDALAREIDDRVEPRLQNILAHPLLKQYAAKLAEHKEEATPPALAAELNRAFKTSGFLSYEGNDWQLQMRRAYFDPLTTIGGQQDEMVGECRWVVKALRQKAGILLANDPRMAPIAAEIRERTHKMLRGGAAYEGARH